MLQLIYCSFFMPTHTCHQTVFRTSAAHSACPITTPASSSFGLMHPAHFFTFTNGVQAGLGFAYVLGTVGYLSHALHSNRLEGIRNGLFSKT